jgi:hypothetical protein
MDKPSENAVVVVDVVVAAVRRADAEGIEGVR